MKNEHFELDTKLEAMRAFIGQRLDQKIKLNDMSNVMCCSARALQYAFKRNFGLTPMQWVREEKLSIARLMLVRSTMKTTVTEIATALGFASTSKFSYYYKSRFGELPSDTLAFHRQMNDFSGKRSKALRESL